MATTVDRPIAAHVVAHATEYPADREGHGGNHKSKENSDGDAQRQDRDPTGTGDSPAVFVDAHHFQDHSLDGMAAYKAAALNVLEPGIDHGPVHPLRGPVDKLPAGNIRHAYQDSRKKGEHHEVNVAT